MIVKFNLFEAINQGEPKANDYVICRLDSSESGASRCNPYLQNMIGRIVDSNPSFAPVGKPFYVEYSNIGHDMAISVCGTIYGSGGITNGSRSYKREEILYWSPDKEDLEKILTQQKFDL